MQTAEQETKWSKNQNDEQNGQKPKMMNKMVKNQNDEQNGQKNQNDVATLHFEMLSSVSYVSEMTIRPL